MPGSRAAMIGRRAWPWFVLAALAGAAAWHVVDFADVPDPEFPRLVRPFFSRRPPAAYRLAEPGDTLDRVGLYCAAAASALAIVAIAARAGRSGGRDLSLWPSALALGLAATWHASTPGPTFDGWHGLGWRTILDPGAPPANRAALIAAAGALVGVVIGNIRARWPRRRELLAVARESRTTALLVAAAVLVALRQGEIPGVEPAGYWPRCAFDLGILAFALALIRLGPIPEGTDRIIPTLGFGAAWGGLVAAGILLVAYHRPLARLHAVSPGRIYISAMPTYRGLEIEQSRLHFRTIVNLFDESSAEASPHHADEIRFVREHGLRYLGSPADGMESDRFLDETLALARDPDAWPILVHCHGCMDRSPAWMGLYRFLVEGRPLDQALREIERHRGSRPKAVVTLQYNRKLPPRAPERYADDPTARLLKRCAAETGDPFLDPRWNRTATGARVVTRIDPDPSHCRP